MQYFRDKKLAKHALANLLSSVKYPREIKRGNYPYSINHIQLFFTDPVYMK